MTAPSIDTIARLTVGAFGVSRMDLLSVRRDAPTVQARMTAYYLARRMTAHSYPFIARFFGDRDHTTIMHGVRRIAEQRERDPALNERVASLERCLTMPAEAL